MGTRINTIMQTCFFALSSVLPRNQAIAAIKHAIARSSRTRPVEGKNPLQLDSKPPSLPLEKYIYNESRYTALAQTNQVATERLLKLAQEDINERWKMYEQLAAMKERKE